MTRTLCCVVVLLSVASIALSQSIGTGPAGIEIGAPCIQTDQCAIQNTHCNANRCTCQPPYKPLTHNICGTFLGDRCNTFTDCVGVSNVQCTDGQCTCSSKLKPNHNNTQCTDGASTVILSLVCMLTAMTSVFVL